MTCLGGVDNAMVGAGLAASCTGAAACAIRAAAPATVTTRETLIVIFGSLGSLGSVGSFGSLGSLGSLGSAGSWGSLWVALGSRWFVMNLRNPRNLRNLFYPNVIERDVLDRLQVVAVRHVDRPVAALHDRRIVETRAGRVLDVPGRTPRRAFVRRDRHRQPIARAGLLVVVDDGEVAARQRDGFDASAWIGESGGRSF